MNEWLPHKLSLSLTTTTGDSDNTGTPLVPDNEQGRSRPNPYSPADPLYGVLIPSCCEAAFFVNIRFYNYNDDPFKFVNLVRLAGAIGMEDGTGTGLLHALLFFLHLSYLCAGNQRARSKYETHTHSLSLSHFATLFFF